MTVQKLPVYVNRYPDGRGSLTCAHCAVDAGLEGAHAIALYADRTEGQAALLWHTEITAEQLIAAAANQCMHLAAYRQ